MSTRQCSHTFKDHADQVRRREAGEGESEVEGEEGVVKEKGESEEEVG